MLGATADHCAPRACRNTTPVARFRTRYERKEPRRSGALDSRISLFAARILTRVLSRRLLVAALTDRGLILRGSLAGGTLLSRWLLCSTRNLVRRRLVLRHRRVRLAGTLSSRVLLP